MYERHIIRNQILKYNKQANLQWKDSQIAIFVEILEIFLLFCKKL